MPDHLVLPEIYLNYATEAKSRKVVTRETSTLRRAFVKKIENISYKN